jgi:hypothetical protein
MAKQKLNIRLVKNHLTPEPYDFNAVVQLNGTLRNKDIAEEFVKHRTEFRLETIVNIMDVIDFIKCVKIASGHSVIDGVAQMRASVTGSFKGEKAQYNPKEHSKSVIFIPSRQMRNELNNTDVFATGFTADGPIINSIEMTPKMEPGLILPGAIMLISGGNLRIASDEQHKDAAGVWFIAADKETTPARVRVSIEYLSDNDPSKLKFVVPPLAPGGYFLEVVTQTGSTGKNLVKDLRTFRFETVLTVE